MSETTLQLIQDRKLLLSQNGKRAHKKITTLSKQINKSIRKDRKCTRLKTIEQHITKNGGVRKALMELKDAKKQWIPKMKSKFRTVSKRADIKALATNYFKKLYTSATSSTDYSEQYQILSNDIEEIEKEPQVLETEVRHAIKSQKLDKAPGPDNISNELLQGCIDSVSPLLTRIFDKILNTGEIPDQWTMSHIILIHKKGAKDDIGNYRPISLMSNIYKIFSKVILQRITRQLDDNQPREQAGFRRNFSTIDHIHTVKQVIEKYREYSKPLYIAYIDYNKAFDSLKHSKIWSTLEKQGVNSAYTSILKKMYDNSKAKIQLESLGEQFPIKRGMRQGDPVSPKIFSAVLEDVFRKLDWS
ncbi:jg23949, partial [Pararge aegeria aegeria]